MIIWIDFETYSELDLNEVGPWVYSRHHSTEILCLSWRTLEESGIWVSETRPDSVTDYLPLRRLFNAPALKRLFALILDRSNLVEAHNAFFEKCIWWNIGQDQFFWPSIAETQWRCSAAKAAACALPRSLEDAGRALSLNAIKNMAGHRVMLKLSKPIKPTGRKKIIRPHPKEDWETLYSYCEDDTKAEQALSTSLPDLTPRELRIWQMDQRVNLRGIPCDVIGAQHAVNLATQWTDALSEELAIITEGRADRATQKQRVLAWLQDQGVLIENMQGNTLDALAPKLPDGNAKRVVEIMRSIGHSSIAKYQTLVASSSGGRLHDTLMYSGAVPTGRWTAKRFQPQNLPRADMREMEFAWSLIHSGDLEMIRLLYGDPMTFLSHAIRGVIRASKGKLFSGDYSAVETRVLFWLAQEFLGLAIFLAGEDIYLDMAQSIYGRPVTKADDDARQLGKRAILGLGFGMGYIKFLITCRTYKMKFSVEFIRAVVPREDLVRIATWIKEKDWHRCATAGLTRADLPELTLMKFIVDRYRTRYSETVCKLWRDMENAAKAAVQHPNKMFVAGRCGWSYDGSRFLTAELPSRRRLYYPFPELDDDGLTHMGVDAKTTQWVRERTYGGKLTENAVQAVARDLLADAMVRLERAPNYDLVLSVHDEAIAESDNGTVDEFTGIISEVPEWAYGLPVKADSWSAVRYRK